MTKPVAVAIISEPKAVSFWSISKQICKVLKANSVDAKLYPWTAHNIKEPNVIFMGNCFSSTINHLTRFIPEKNVIFYAVTEGIPLLSNVNLQIADNITFIAPSLYAKKCFENANLKIKAVIPHGIDLTIKPDLNFKAKIKQFIPQPCGVEPSNVMFCVSGNVQRKGLEKLLIAYKTIEHLVKDAYLILHSGTGDVNIPGLETALDLQRFLWTNSWGMLDPYKIAALYNLSDFYVQPSMVEGFGLTYLEAFQWELPVIGVNCPATNEIVKDGYTGILLPVTRTEDIVWQQHHAIRLHHFTTDSLIDAMLCLTDENTRIRMSVNAKKEKPKWDMQKIYHEFLKYLN
jgi:glycosyltransferase involved in cell wall biosynthesis